MLGTVYIGDLALPLALVPGGKPLRVFTIPISEGETGREGAIVFQTAHLGFGESEYVTAGKYHYAIDTDASLPREILRGAAVFPITINAPVTPRGFFDQDGYLFILAGRYVYRVKAADNTVATSKDFKADDWCSSAAKWQAKHYIALDPNGVLSGCAVTAQTPPAMAVNVAAGSIRLNAVIYSVVAGSVTIDAADPTNPRKDLIYATATGLGKVTGTPAASPVLPDTPTNAVALAQVDVPAGDTSIESGQITDKRNLSFTGKAFQQLTTINATPPDTWTAGPTGKEATRLLTGADRLWRGKSTASAAIVSGCAADPMTAGNWSADESVGEPSVPITGLATLGTMLLVAKEDGLYGVDAETETLVNLLPDLAGFRKTDNGWAVITWQGATHLPHVKGFFRYRPGFVQSVGLENLPLNRSPITGPITAAKAVGAELWLAVWNGTDTYLLVGKPVGDSLAFHPRAKLAGVQCYAMHLSTLWANPRLFVGYGTNIAYIELGEGVPEQRAAEYRFAKSGSIYWGKHDGGSPRTLKLMREIELDTDNCNPQNYFRPHIRMDEGEWLTLPAIARDGHVRVPIPDCKDALGYGVELRVEHGSDDYTTAMRVRMPIIIRYNERPRTARGYEAVVSLPEGLYWKHLDWLLDKLGQVLPCRLPTAWAGDLQLIGVEPQAPQGAQPHEVAGLVSIRLREI